MSFLRSFITQLSDRSEGLDPNFSEDLTEVEAVLSGLPERDAKLYSAFALLLGRVAFADSSISEGERKRAVEILVDQMKISLDLAKSVAQIALAKIENITFESHLVTRQVNELADRDQKRGMIRCLFRLASEDTISTEESEEIRRISKSLGFSQKEYAEFRSEFRDDLAVLR